MHGNNQNKSMLTCNAKQALVLYLFNLHFYPFLSTSFVGRNCNMCSYAMINSYCITLCILINVIETLELKPTTINSIHHYIKRQYSEQQAQQIFGVPKVLHITQTQKEQRLIFLLANKKSEISLLAQVTQFGNQLNKLVKQT